MLHVCTKTIRYPAGRLHKVADDAPARVEEWPLQIFYIPGKEADDMEAGEQDSNRPLSSRSGESHERGMPRVESLGGDRLSNLWVSPRCD